MMKLWKFLRDHYKNGLLWELFLNILGLLLKVKIQNQNIFGGLPAFN